MDPRVVLTEWIGSPEPGAPLPLNRRGIRGDHLRGTSPARYADDVASWLAFIEDTVRIGAWHAEPSHIKTWLDMEGGAPRSRARRVSAVGAFYEHCVRSKYTLHNPVDPRLSGKAHLSAPALRLTEGQMHLVRWGADQIEGDFAERDRLLVYLLLAGLRPRQVAEFELSGVTFEQSRRMTAVIRQRGGSQKRMAFPDEVADLVRAYLPVRKWRGPDSHEDRGPLLVTYRGHRLDLNVTPRTILRVALAHAESHPDPDAPELPAGISPDTVALSPSPFEPLRDLTKP